MAISSLAASRGILPSIPFLNIVAPAYRHRLVFAS